MQEARDDFSIVFNYACNYTEPFFLFLMGENKIGVFKNSRATHTCIRPASRELTVTGLYVDGCSRITSAPSIRRFA